MSEERGVFEWLMMIGSLGGLGSIVVGIYRWLVKPKLIINLDDNAAISYSENTGNSIALKMSFLAERKGAVVKRLKVTLTHKSGAAKILVGEYINEHFGDSSVSSNGANLSIRNAKFQKMLGLFVSTNYFSDRTVFFIDKEFLESNNKLITSLTDKILFYKKTCCDLMEIKKAKEYIDIIDNFNKSQYWREGHYNGLVFIESNGKEKKKSFCFDLSEKDLEVLNQNREIYARNFEKFVFNNLNDETKEGYKDVYCILMDCHKVS